MWWLRHHVLKHQQGKEGCFPWCSLSKLVATLTHSLSHLRGQGRIPGWCQDEQQLGQGLGAQGGPPPCMWLQAGKVPVRKEGKEWGLGGWPKWHRGWESQHR